MSTNDDFASRMRKKRGERSPAFSFSSFTKGVFVETSAFDHSIDGSINESMSISVNVVAVQCPRCSRYNLNTILRGRSTVELVCHACGDVSIIESIE